MTDNNALAQELEALPDIMHARITPIEQRETEYVLPASLKFRLLAALRTPAPAPVGGDVVGADIMVGEFIARWDEAAAGVVMDADTAQALAREFKRMHSALQHPAPASDEIAKQLSNALVERNEDRFRSIAFVHRHEIIDALERLASQPLADSETRAAIAAMQGGDAVLAERERCAQVAERYPSTEYADIPIIRGIAAAIRGGA